MLQLMRAGLFLKVSTAYGSKKQAVVTGLEASVGGPRYIGGDVLHRYKCGARCEQ